MRPARPDQAKFIKVAAFSRPDRPGCPGSPRG
ncbi:hypothetical protein GA0115240_102410, partial [Streptomyces sp. DvalAA-14]